MKSFKSKTIKNLIIILAITTILSGLLPNYVRAATDTENGGGILEPIEQFVVFLCDKVMQWLQNTFVSTDTILRVGGTYDFQYSPAIIFSGDVPALDINFIKPNQQETKTVKCYDTYVRSFLLSNVNNAISTAEAREEFNRVAAHRDSRYIKQSVPEESREAYYYVDEDYENLIIGCHYIVMGATSYTGGPTVNKFYVEIVSIEENNIQFEYKEEEVTYKSTAYMLQNTIASWYKALRRIALVGLLSVLVYVGIRIVLSSSSQDKAKYKNMLKDWLVAVCLLFTLHYIMNITITVTNEISDIFATGKTDVLLNDLRGDIHIGNSWGEVLAKVIMYVVLVIYTIIFTIQYLVRVIYMAFYTLIAPLITLTYPLDKIKDGQAQAFTMWIREYVFTALVQVIHLVIYFVLVSSALSLVTDYPLYAIIVIAFIKKAEDMIKKMFGFDKAETVGTLGAAATGALIVSAIDKLKMPSKGGNTGGGAGGSSNSNVRTANNNPLASLQGGNGAPIGGSGTPEIDREKGARTLVGKYYKKVAGGALGTLTGGAGAILGFASGVAQGDIGKALAGTVAGGKVGNSLAQRGVEGVSNIGGNVKNSINNIADTWREGAYGEGYAEYRKFMRGSTYKALQSNPNFSEASIQAMVEAGITEQRDMEKILNSGQNVNDAIGYYTLAQKCPDDIYYDDAKLEMYLQDKGLSQTDAKIMRNNMKKYR